MSGFIVASRSAALSDEAVDDKLEAAIAAFGKKGMLLTHTGLHSGFVIYLFANDSHDPARVQTTDTDGRFCTYVGTLIYRGCTGGLATAAILGDLRRGQTGCIDAALGNFCVLINDDQGLRIATDRAGLHHVYHNDALSLVCNSFLAAVCSSPHRTLQTQEMIEYVQLGATFGSESLVREVHLLRPECEIRIQGQTRRIISTKSAWNAHAALGQNTRIEERIADTIETCDDYYRQIAQTYGDKVTAALSGGYDSRLSLALMKRNQIAPRLFVYGAGHDSDVEIARLICRSERLDLNHIDRGARPPLEPDEYWRNQDDVFHGLDGLTQYGFACDADEVSHRRERVTGGLLAINGGGGEIWRDFWKLPDKPMQPAEFVRAYFGGRLGGLLDGETATRQFLLGLAGKVRTIVGGEAEPMSAAVVQSLYARFRLRFWQGKNNSVDNHIGYALTPFSENRFSAPAMWIPMEAKRDGWFERQLIRRTSPKLARYPSSYGYDFEHGPSFLSRLRTSLTYRLPTWLRKFRRSSGNDCRRSYYHSDRYVSARFGHGPLEVEKYFSLARLRDPLAFSRALTVERFLRGEWT